jgi:hypothetical protein
MTREELEVAIAFARLELLELEHGRRAITDCPGVENIAKEAQAERARQRFRALRPRPTPSGKCDVCGHDVSTHNAYDECTR